MAGGFDAALLQECICKVCCDLKTEPRDLECGHSFCTLCLRDFLLQLESSGSFHSVIECPLCSHHTPTSLGVLSLPRSQNLEAPLSYMKNTWVHSKAPDSPQPPSSQESSTFDFSSSQGEWKPYNPPGESTSQTVPEGQVNYFPHLYPTLDINDKPEEIPPIKETPIEEPEIEPLPPVHINSEEQKQPAASEEPGMFTGFLNSLISGFRNIIHSPEEYYSTATGKEQEVVYCAPFKITKEVAQKALENWLSSLWFAPSNLTKESLSTIHSAWIPFYSIEAASQTEYHGSKIDITGRNIPVQGVVSNKYKALLCASQNAELRVFIKELQDSFAIGLAKTPIESVGVPFNRGLDWREVWNEAKVNIDEKEIEQCKKKGKSQGLDQVTSTVGFSDIRVKLLYLPVYHGSYKYKEKVYRIAINGQNGKVIGERSYGAGTLGSLVGRLWGNK